MGYWTQTSMGSANASLPKPSSSKQFMTGRAPLMPKAKPTCYSSTLARPLTPCPTDDCWWNYNTMVLMARPATGLLLYCVVDDKEWSSMELAQPGHQYSQASLRAQWSVPYCSSSTSMTSPATSIHEYDSLLTTVSSTGKSAALKTTTSCKTTSANSRHGQKDGRWHSSQKSATSSRSPTNVISVNFCTTSTT